MYIGLAREELELIKAAMDATMPLLPAAQAISGRIADALKTDAAEEMKWAEKAFDKHHRDGECEVDFTADPLVSHGDEGAYVMAWVWVSNEDMGIEPEEDDDDEEDGEICDGCDCGGYDCRNRESVE